MQLVSGRRSPQQSLQETPSAARAHPTASQATDAQLTQPMVKIHITTQAQAQRSNARLRCLHTPAQTRPSDRAWSRVCPSIVLQPDPSLTPSQQKTSTDAKTQAAGGSIARQATPSTRCILSIASRCSLASSTGSSTSPQPGVRLTQDAPCRPLRMLSGLEAAMITRTGVRLKMGCRAFQATNLMVKPVPGAGSRPAGFLAETEL